MRPAPSPCYNPPHSPLAQGGLHATTCPRQAAQDRLYHPAQRGLPPQHPHRRIPAGDDRRRAARCPRHLPAQHRPRPAARLARARTPRISPTWSPTHPRSTSRKRSTPRSSLPTCMATSRATQQRATVHAARSLCRLQRPAGGRRPHRLLSARGQLVQPHDPRR